MTLAIPQVPCECGRFVLGSEHHCWFHHRDETGGKIYIVCGECWHVYPTARALRKEYRKACPKPWAEKRWPDIPRWKWQWMEIRTLARIIWPRASKIGFCQLCVHDF